MSISFWANYEGKQILTFFAPTIKIGVLICFTQEQVKKICQTGKNS